MQTNHESKGPAVLFLGAWWALSQYAPLADYAFITAVVLMVILWLAVKFAAGPLAAVRKSASLPLSGHPRTASE
jgi:hypothetical protein